MADIDTYVFIGGPSDGQRITGDPRREDIRVVLKHSFNFTNLNEPVTIKEVWYRKMKFSGERNRFSFYAVEGMTGDEVFARLFNKYTGG